VIYDLGRNMIRMSVVWVREKCKGIGGGEIGGEESTKSIRKGVAEAEAAAATSDDR